MRDGMAACCFLTLCLSAAPAWSGPRAVVDDAGREVRLAAPAKRIIPLYAAFTDILAAMGRSDLVVARTKADAAPLDGASVPVVGTHMRPNMELVLSLKPDLALQMGGRAEAAQSVATLEKFGVPVAFFHVRSFADLFSVITKIGVLTGEEKTAARLVADLQRRLDAIAEVVAAEEKKPSVFFEVRYPNLLAAGPDSMVADIIHAAGGRNALMEKDGVSQHKGRVVRLSEEELIRLDPDVYLIQSGPMNKNPSPLAARPHFASLRAAKSGRNAVVDEHIFSRPGPKAADAVAILARLLYPGLFLETIQ